MAIQKANNYENNRERKVKTMQRISQQTRVNIKGKQENNRGHNTQVLGTRNLRKTLEKITRVFYLKK